MAAAYIYKYKLLFFVWEQLQCDTVNLHIGIVVQPSHRLQEYLRD
jgi:hypothetical protein